MAHEQYCNCCPPPDWEKNRFQPENRFIGDIENGVRYPFGSYTKEEADERFAKKQTEADLTALTETVNGKANESECVDIRARLDALEYTAISINSYTINPAFIRLGAAYAVNLAWSLNKVATLQDINGTAVTGNTKQFTGVSVSTTYTLTVSDGQQSVSESLRVETANDIYYGVATNIENITGLTKVLSNDPERTFSVTAGEGQYIIYAIPKRLGDVEFYVSGFEGGFEPAVEQRLTNANGYQEDYRIYRSTNANLGETVVEVKEG